MGMGKVSRARYNDSIRSCGKGAMRGGLRYREHGAGVRARDEENMQKKLHM